MDVTDLEKEVNRLKVELQLLQTKHEIETLKNEQKSSLSLAQTLKDAAEKLTIPTATPPGSSFEVDEKAIYPAKVEVHKSLQRAAKNLSSYIQSETFKDDNRFIIADDALILDLSFYRTTLAYIEGLKEQYTAEPKQSAPGGAATFVPEVASALALGTKLFDIGAAIANYFKTTTKLKGYDVEVDVMTLVAMILEDWQGHSRDQILQPSFISAFDPDDFKASMLVASLVELLKYRHEAESEDDARFKALNELTEKLITQLYQQEDSTVPSNIAKLLVVEKINNELKDSKNYLLLLRINAVGGGSYSVERGNKKELYYHGGVIVTCFLIDKYGLIKDTRTFIEDPEFVKLNFKKVEQDR